METDEENSDESNSKIVKPPDKREKKTDYKNIVDG